MSLLERVFYFHQEIVNNNYPNSKTITEQFEVSVATSRRDINYLRDRLCAPLAFDSKKNGFYYSEDGFHLPFEESPRIVFLLAMLNKFAGEAGLSGLPEVSQLEARLSNMISADYGKVVDTLLCEWIEVESIDHQVFETIIEAVVKKQVLAFHYRPVDGKDSVRSGASLKIINYQGRWYLYAFCNLRQDNRLFHIARMSSARLTGDPIPPDTTFDQHQLGLSFGIFQGAPRYQAEILFTSTAAELVQNQYWHKDQELKKVEEGVLLKLPVSDDRELVMKILQYGGMARVLAPAELIDRIKGEIFSMAKNYEVG